MTPTDRDRLVALKKAKAEEWKVSERQVRRWLVKLKQEGDQAIIHGLRGRSNRKIEEETREKAVEILRRDVYRGFGPALAAEYLENKHQVKVSKETIRQWMRQAGWWRSRKPKVVVVHVWRERRERFGELVPWDTSTHDWLEGRGEVGRRCLQKGGEDFRLRPARVPGCPVPTPPYQRDRPSCALKRVRRVWSMRSACH